MMDARTPDAPAPAFLFTACQVGAEAALKSEVARRWPLFQFAFSRPGFVTFKLPPEPRLPDDFDLQSVFARAYGFSLSKVTAADSSELAAQVAALVARRSFDALHVWQRDTARPGWRGFEPHLTERAVEAEAAIRDRLSSGGASNPLPRQARPGQRVLDCMWVEKDLWWVGYHQARQGSSCYPGGLRNLVVPETAVSRAWLKMEEALDWSALPIRPGQRFVELGCAPGGASQSLLAHGLKVIGVDPARVDPRVLEHPNFQHIRKRAADVRRREFRGVSWLAADMNVAPDFTLDAVEAIVTHPTINIRGLILTLKLLDWQLADNTHDYLKRIRGWGYPATRAAQLAHHRQEICVAALRTAKPGRPRTTKRR